MLPLYHLVPDVIPTTRRAQCGGAGTVWCAACDFIKPLSSTKKDPGPPQPLTGTTSTSRPHRIWELFSLPSFLLFVLYPNSTQHPRRVRTDGAHAIIVGADLRFRICSFCCSSLLSFPSARARVQSHISCSSKGNVSPTTAASSLIVHHHQLVSRTRFSHYLGTSLFLLTGAQFPRTGFCFNSSQRRCASTRALPTSRTIPPPPCSKAKSGLISPLTANWPAITLFRLSAHRRSRRPSVA